MHYYPHNIGDFALETRGLTYEQIGILVTLMDRYASTQLPISEAWVNVAYQESSKCQAIALLNAFFVQKDGGFVHPRLEQMIVDFEEKSKKRSVAGKKGAQVRSKQQVPSNCQANDEQVPSYTNNQEPLTNLEELPIGSSRGNSCADAPEFPPEAETEPQLIEKPLKQQNCPVKEIVDSYNEILGPWLGKVLDVTPQRRTAIRARWRDVIRVCGIEDQDRATSIRATRAYFEKVSRSDWLMGRKPSSNGRPWKADFDWILQQRNFTKIFEGKYENGR